MVKNKWKSQKFNKLSDNEIEFKTVAGARRFLAQMQSLHSKYSRRTYGRRGKIVYRY